MAFGLIFVDPAITLQRHHHQQIHQLGEGLGVGDNIVHAADAHQLDLMREPALFRRRIVAQHRIGGGNDLRRIAVSESVSRFVEIGGGDARRGLRRRAEGQQREAQQDERTARQQGV